MSPRIDEPVVCGNMLDRTIGRAKSHMQHAQFEGSCVDALAAVDSMRMESLDRNLHIKQSRLHAPRKLLIELDLQ
jgi:hypothetical protein